MASSAAATAMAEGYVVGVKNGTVVPRLEIDEFVQDKDLLNMFLLALERLQDEKYYLDSFSWFQISGIHGRPFVDWDKLGSKDHTRDIYAGYCSHSAVTFPTWHRPYLAMMEQSVYVTMLNIAQDFKDDATKKRYLSACERFRFPYWDPCIARHTSFERESDHPNEYGIPLIVSSQMVNVRRPAEPEILKPIPNPLYQYNFPKQEQPVNNADFLWADLAKDRQIGRNLRRGNILLTEGGNVHTVRAPNKDKATADKDITDYISEHIQSEVGSSLYKLLTTRQPWTRFSNDGVTVRRPDGQDMGWVDRRDDNDITIYHTIEGFHNNIHGHVGTGTLPGGSGHMGDPQLAAFDPIFWLHHCNVDRITAMWQASRGIDDPDSWFTEHRVNEPTWTDSSGTLLTPDSFLVPFRKFPRNPGHDIFWTSKECRDWKKAFGYIYQGKKIVPGPDGQNKIITFPIDLENTNKDNLIAYWGQFYAWMDHSGRETHQPTPPLIKQFYPLDLSTVEALYGGGPKTTESMKLTTLHTKMTTQPTQATEPNQTAQPAQQTIEEFEQTTTTIIQQTISVEERPQLHRGHPSTQTPSYPLPNTHQPDYRHVQDLCDVSGNDLKLRQWNVLIHCEKFALLGSFQIFIFVGPLNSMCPDEWPAAPNLAGTYTIFASDPYSGGCANCEGQQKGGLLVGEVVPLTGILMRWIRKKERCGENGDVLESLKPNAVNPFLDKNLHWRVASIHGQHHDRTEIPGLKVILFDQVVCLPPTYDTAPVYEARYAHTQPTHGKEGGLQHHERAGFLERFKGLGIS